MGDAMSEPVVILGGGVNGVAVARELAINGVPVWVVDREDIACGATARSSRLIHGGLRYLEYGEFRLVKESLAERSRLNTLAPHLVHPLPLAIPVARRTGGLWQSVSRFVFGRKGSTKQRGLWLVRSGLAMYDRFVKDANFPSAKTFRVGTPGLPDVDPQRFQWLCRYSDGHMDFPERFVVSMLHDAQAAAHGHGVEFRVLTGCEATLQAGRLQLTDAQGTQEVSPRLIVNATGAWGDFTLQTLRIPSPKLFGGTKGSHFFTANATLREALGQGGLYAEADDGRLVFVLPASHGVMVGTTDERFEGSPGEAVASEDELQYLLQMVNALFPTVSLTRDDVDMHYAGVRPLPRADGATSAISRDHDIVEHPVPDGPLVLTLVGGKLTTARAFGELVADRVLEKIGVTRQQHTRERVLPGGEDCPDSEEQRLQWQRDLATRCGRPLEVVQELWPLFGTTTERVLQRCADKTTNRHSNGTPAAASPLLPGCAIPEDVVLDVIEMEWVRTLADLVERRLMLLYRPGLSRACLQRLAELLAEAGRISAEDVAGCVAAEISRLQQLYGKRLVETNGEPVPTATVKPGGTISRDG